MTENDLGHIEMDDLLKAAIILAKSAGDIEQRGATGAAGVTREIAGAMFSEVLSRLHVIPDREVNLNGLQTMNVSELRGLREALAAIGKLTAPGIVAALFDPVVHVVGLELDRRHEGENGQVH